MNHHCGCNTIFLVEVKGWSMVIPHWHPEIYPLAIGVSVKNPNSRLDQGPRSATLTGKARLPGAASVQSLRQQDGYAWTGTAMPMVTLAKQRHAEDYRVFCRRFIQKANHSFKMFQDIHLWLFEFKRIRYGKMFRPLQSEKVQASPLFRAYMALIQGLRCPCS